MDVDLRDRQKSVYDHQEMLCFPFVEVEKQKHAFWSISDLIVF